MNFKVLLAAVTFIGTAASAAPSVFIPKGAFHSTVNTGWEPLRLLALYNPGGPEKVLEGLPDFQQVGAGSVPDWTRS